MKEYDLAVVGAGAGLLIVEEGLRRGLRCALVESGKMGGTCLTRGCIPSKILIQPADLVREAERGRKIGVHLKLESIDWDLVSRRIWSKIDKSREIEDRLAGADGLTIHKGTGVFTGPGRMRVPDADGPGAAEEFTARRFVLAAGARSAVPPLPGLEEAGYITSESFFGEKFPARPWKSLVIIGGGIVAAEFAHAFAALGTKVTVLEMLPRLLSSEEPAVSALVERSFRRRMDVRLNSRAASVRREKGGKVVAWENTETGETGEAEGEEILVAVGRKSNADLLRPEVAGIRTDDRGWIRTDGFLETSQSGVWAIGDIIGGFQFRHKANYDAAVCLKNMFGPAEKKTPVDYSTVPWAVFTDPQIGRVGLTEREALDAGHEISVAVSSYSAVAKGFAMGFEPGDDDDGFVKLVVERSRRILGVHIAGPEAALLVQPFVYLMNAGFVCPSPAPSPDALRPPAKPVCPETGAFSPILRSMIIHPSLSEAPGWAFGDLRPVNFPDR